MEMSAAEKVKSKRLKIVSWAILAVAIVLLLAVQIPNLILSPRALSRENDCINNLRQIDGAKRSWMLELSGKAGDVLTTNDVAPLLRPESLKCPAGGVYSVGRVGELPTYSVAGHALPP